MRFDSPYHWVVGLICIAWGMISLQPRFATATEVQLIGVVSLAGTTEDRSGLSGNLESGTPSNTFGGLSAIDYTGSNDRYFVLSDRGPADGETSFPCRVHEIDLKIGEVASALSVKIISSHLLKTGDGRQLTGNVRTLRDCQEALRCLSYDPEGLRCYGPNQLIISDEYGPKIDIFDRAGRLEASIPLPPAFALSELRKPPLQVGAFTNRGLEGLAISPDQQTLIAAMQGPLVQDGRLTDGKCVGIHTRWFIHHLASRKSQQWIYTLDNESTGVSEVLAVSNSQFLVLERDSRAGEAARTKRIYLASAKHVSDVQNIDSLRGELPTGVLALHKQLLIDLLDPAYGMSGAQAPEKPEGLTWGPTRPDGRKTLIVCFDNDFEATIPTVFMVFAIAL